jgi:hypothetical protein
MSDPLIAQITEFSPSQVLALWHTAMWIGALVLISLVGVGAGAWTNVNRVRLEHALKQQMLDRASRSTR